MGCNKGLYSSLWKQEEEAAQIQEGPVLTWVLEDEQAFVRREGRALEVWQVHRGTEHGEFSEERGTSHQTNWTPSPSVPTGAAGAEKQGLPLKW